MNPLSHGVLNLVKPPGMTSHDAVAWARRVLKTRRVGHTGTLDPAAAGVLPLCVGAATRLVEHLQAGTKEYLAEATFGYETDTLDAVGEIVARREASFLDAARVQNVLQLFRGDIEQEPPLHSAIKIGGRKLYEIARAGQSIEIPRRSVTISRLELVQFWPAREGAHPRAFLRIECSGGTYIRALVRDIGRALETAATMTFLVRTRSGRFDLNEAVTCQEFEAAPRLLGLREVLESLADEVCINDDLVLRLWQGQTVVLPQSSDPSPVLLSDRQGSLLALAVPAPAQGGTQGLYRAEKVFDLRGE